MRVFKFLSVLFIFCLFLFGSFSTTSARCGTFYNSQPAGENCVDAATGATFNATAICSQNPQVCCESTTQCNEAFGEQDDPFGDVDDEEVTPVPAPEAPPVTGTQEAPVSNSDSIFQQQQTVGCGSYFVTEPDPSRRCVNAEVSGTPAINPYVVCGNGVSCCPSSDMCPVPPPLPEPEPDEISTEQCGSLQRDGTCRDLRSLIIVGAQQCRSSNGVERIETQCCTNTNLCEERPESGDFPASDEPLNDFTYCLQVPDGTQRVNCERCFVEATETEGRVYTALGCIRTGGRGLTEDLVRVLMGVSGGIALLSILAGAFLYSVSQGDSSKVKEAKSLITAAVSGLFFIIFSIFILQFFGVSILRIPGLGGTAQNSSAPANNQASCATEGSSASGGNTCCSGLIPSGPNQMCRQPQFVVDGGFYLFEDDQSTQFCTLGADSEYLEAVSLTSADVTCVTALNGISCASFSPVQVPTTLGQAQTREGGMYRCTGPVEMVTPVQTAFSQYLSTTLGAENSAFYRIYVEERVIGAVRYYDVHMMIEPSFWETLPQSVRDDLNRGPQLQLGYNATWAGTIEGESIERSTSYSGYATLLVQVVSFSNG